MGHRHSVCPLCHWARRGLHMGPMSTFLAVPALLPFVQPKSRAYDLDITSGKVSVGGDPVTIQTRFRSLPDPTSHDTVPFLCVDTPSR
jgi:hypothetical protein